MLIIFGLWTLKVKKPIHGSFMDATYDKLTSLLLLLLLFLLLLLLMLKLLFNLIHYLVNLAQPYRTKTLQ